MKGSLILCCLLGILLKDSSQLSDTTALYRLNSSHWTFIRNLAALRPIPHVPAQVHLNVHRSNTSN